MKKLCLMLFVSYFAIFPCLAEIKIINESKTKSNCLAPQSNNRKDNDLDIGFERNKYGQILGPEKSKETGKLGSADWRTLNNKDNVGTPRANRPDTGSGSGCMILLPLIPVYLLMAIISMSINSIKVNALTIKENFNTRQINRKLNKSMEQQKAIAAAKKLYEDALAQFNNPSLSEKQSILFSFFYSFFRVF